ncbi:serine/threonine-protein kinase AFC2 isoform X1 [Canna indica]|uniref:dual-specificity kinase n=1 Tax=Canna indica TaxID=4628 RepID=A0AAQ3K3L9_9LILI|nr:serine/threonine-protein kinase AFC2 isoform X1 [Canna indica]
MRGQVRSLRPEVMAANHWDASSGNLVGAGVSLLVVSASLGRGKISLSSVTVGVRQRSPDSGYQPLRAKCNSGGGTCKKYFDTQGFIFLSSCSKKSPPPFCPIVLFVSSLMEFECLSEFPHTRLDGRPRKRPRLGWDIDPQTAAKARMGMLCGQEVNLKSLLSLGTTVDDTCSSQYMKGLIRDPSPPWREDDKDGHYKFELGENLTARYKIHSKMGEGTFGQVLKCWDREREEMVAIKIVRGIRKYREAAMIEIDMLQQLGTCDKSRSRCVQIWDWFDYRNHICIVFEKLGPSLYDFLRKNGYRSFSIDLVRKFGRQLLECVAFMHDMRLIHTDLKPENILLVSPEYIKVPDYKVSSRPLKEGSYFKRIPKSSAIKVIDFGSTTYDRQDNNYVVSTRHYRAPEVILGLGWSYACDIWSVGCILVELCSGETLFQTHENLEHLALMERVLGPLPSNMLRLADRDAEKYIRRGRLNWPDGATSRESMKAVLKLPRLQNLVAQHTGHCTADFIDLLQGLLRYDPVDRLAAKEALLHPFFTRL